MCGEHPPQCRKPDDRPGSSPRVRGTLPVVAEHLLRHGIIPACAGNTDFAALLVLPSRDHPRVCGEHLIPHLATSFGVGSSPRVRGTPEAFDAFMPYGGIIPACAGNTGRPHSPLAATGDHPRVCGEHELPELRQAAIRGSSPRVRGTPSGNVVAQRSTGIIPACAGNTSPEPPATCSPRDHPRVCGEHVAVYVPVVPFGGSSPRVRGTQRMCFVCDTRLSIIPACAGNTRREGRSVRRSRDHPRVCGEHSPPRSTLTK